MMKPLIVVEKAVARGSRTSWRQTKLGWLLPAALAILMIQFHRWAWGVSVDPLWEFLASVGLMLAASLLPLVTPTLVVYLSKPQLRFFSGREKRSEVITPTSMIGVVDDALVIGGKSRSIRLSQAEFPSLDLLALAQVLRRLAMEGELCWDDLARSQPGVFERSREIWIRPSPLGILVGLALAILALAVLAALLALAVLGLSWIGDLVDSV